MIIVDVETEYGALQDRWAHVKTTISHSVLWDTSRVRTRASVVANGRNHAWNSIRTAIISVYDSDCLDGGCWGKGDAPPIVATTHICLLTNPFPIIIYRGICGRHLDEVPITSAYCWSTM